MRASSRLRERSIVLAAALSALAVMAQGAGVSAQPETAPHIGHVHIDGSLELAI